MPEVNRAIVATYLAGGNTLPLSREPRNTLSPTMQDQSNARSPSITTSMFLGAFLRFLKQFLVPIAVNPQFQDSEELLSLFNLASSTSNKFLLLTLMQPCAPGYDRRNYDEDDHHGT